MGKYTEFLDFTEQSFTDCFTSKGYIKEQPVKITSRIDTSVDLIGSKISALKHYVLDENINNNGHCLIQDCFRAHKIKELQTSEPTKFGTCFRIMGTLTKPNIDKVVYDTFDFLTNSKYMGIPYDDLLIRINSQDADLMKSVKKTVNPKIVREIDSVSAHYKHNYGLDDQNIFGRDFNIAVRKTGTKSFVNAGTIVLMEQGDNKIAIDMGIGNITLAMCKFGYDYSIKASRMADVFNIDSVEKMKIADAMIAISTLQNENVMDLKSHRKTILWKYRKYNQALMYWKNKLGFSDMQIQEYMEQYINLEFKNNSYKSEISWQR